MASFPRFHIVDHDEARKAPNALAYIGYSPDEELRNYLIDQRTGCIVYMDGGEPEDQTLRRDQRALVDLLNEVADGR